MSASGTRNHTPDPTGATAMMTAASAVANSSSLEALTRPFLDVLHGLTGLESTYLTEVRPDDDEQTILFSDNRGNIDIREGLTVGWQDTLCRRALESGKSCTSDVQTDLPGSEAAVQLGLKTYVSVPVVGQDEALIGTLCGASGQSVAVSPEVLNVMDMLARLIASQWERDRLHSAALERANSAEERLRQRATFLAEAEHKLKSPLTILRGWTEMLADAWEDISPAMRDEAIQTMLRASKDASRQLDELLDEARSEVLSTTLDVSRIHLDVLMEEVAKQLRGVAASRGHIVTLKSNCAVEVDADREALWQVLWHLGENALKYSPNGGQIELSTDTLGGSVVIKIEDEGMGVPEDIDVFAPFARGSGEEMAGIPGTGLGLHIVRNLVHSMGGHVTAARRPDRGSTFEVTLQTV